MLGDTLFAGVEGAMTREEAAGNDFRGRVAETWIKLGAPYTPTFGCSGSPSPVAPAESSQN